MKIPADEQETVIQFDRHSKTATVDTTDTTMMNKLDKLVAKSDKWKVIREDYSQDNELIGKCYETSKRLISYRSGKSQGHSMSDEQKLAAAERMRHIRDKSDS